MTRFLRILPLLAVLGALLAAPASAYKVDRTPPPAAFVGVAYSFTFGAEGGTAPHTFKVDSGALPPGLSLSDEGAVSGTPTSAGTWPFYIQATDSFGLKSEVLFSITVKPKLIVSTGSLPDATVGVPYSYSLATSGGSSNAWKVSSGSLPAGITLSAAGVLQGTPGSLGASTFVVSATSGTQTDTKQLTLTVRAPLAVSTAAMPPAIVGQPFTTQFAASGGTGGYAYKLTSGSLPPGLVLDGGTGILDGTPRTAGAFTAVLAVTAAGGGAAQASVTISVRRQVAITTASLPVGKVGARYVGSIRVVGGIAPVTLSSSSQFPPGVQLNAETGKLAGRPTRRGAYRIVLTANDAYGGQTSRRLVIRIR